MLETRSRASKLTLQIVVTIMILPFVYPLWAMVDGSLAGQGWDNYRIVLSVSEVPLFFRNSIIIASGTIAIVYTCTMLAAFGFAKLRLPAREGLFWLLLAALTLPEVILIAPLFAMSFTLGLYNSYWSVILPLSALFIPFTVLITRAFVRNIPDELFEAARIDGANVLAAFRYIILPLTRPIGAAVVVLTLIHSWNNLLLPLVFLQDATRQTVTLLPLYFVGEFTNDQTKVLAAATIIAIPQILAYVCLQKYFERGLSAGALK